MVAAPGWVRGAGRVEGFGGRRLLSMSVQHVFDEVGRWDGRSLSELVPLIVDEVVARVDPHEVILFGSVARGDDGPDSDIDLLVVLDALEAGTKREIMAHIRRSITAVAPIDVLVTSVAELRDRSDQVGSVFYWPVREGRSVFSRAGARAV